MANPPLGAAAVHLGDDRVGLLQQAQGTTILEFDASYWDLPQRPVLGQVFEERMPQDFRQGGGRSPEWFSNLLPEEGMRQRIADQHGFSARNEYRLLLALGGDLPGAVRVIPQVAKPLPQYPVDFGDGAESSPDGSPGSEPLIKFSIAGVQLKLSMVMSGGSLTLAGHGELGDRIVKLPRGPYAGVPENEFTMMRWAQATGITAPAAELCPAAQLGPLPAGFEPISDAPIYVVRRFDRQADGSVVHMEDMNQVVNHWPERKYEKISFEQVGLLIHKLCGPEDFEEYLRRLVFCIAIGNEDAHLKNWTLWYPDRINPRLSPAYDLVSTVQYEGLDRAMALKLGGSKDPRKVSRDTLEHMATRVGHSGERAGQIVEETLVRMRTSWAEIEGDSPVGPEFIKRLRDYQKAVPLLAPLVSGL